MKFTAVDAFCGAGGLSLGLKSAGFDLRLSFDNDPNCINTLQKNKRFIKHLCVQEDIRSMLGGKLLSLIGLKVGELDLLAGGPPCQGFSIQRTVGGDHDERNLLVNDYGDLIKEVMPRFFLVENVPGIGGERGKKILSKFVQRMELVGYHIHEKIIDAQYYGVPQRRRRYFIVGERTGLNSAIFFCWPEPLKSRPPTVKEIIGLLPSPPENGGEHPTIPNHRADRLSAINKQRLLALSEGQGRTMLPDHLLANCHKISAEISGHRNVYGRMSWDEVAPTITARFDSFTRGKFGHPSETRSISLREGAMLQTFPNAFIFTGNKVDVARQIGNAIPPHLASAIAKSIIRALNKHKRAN